MVMPPPPPLRSRRRRTLVGSLAGGLAAPALAAGAGTAAAAGPKVLRVMFNSAETGFDPARISDLYSRTVTAHIFASLYGYDQLARPVKAVPRLEHDGETIGEQPVGTGPFRLKPWVRGSKIVLEHNPQYRAVHHDAQPAANDADGQAPLMRRGQAVPAQSPVMPGTRGERLPPRPVPERLVALRRCGPGPA
ncbi:MAG: ABC transporter substrate-binding protein [Aquabacterium sp.]|nr:ABC transporter substrate-binding protein [Aquabacterium sp.]